MYDTIIIGAGPAGFSAALYACRYGMKTLILEEQYTGGQIVNTHEIENYPGFAGIGGGDLMDAFEKQVMGYSPELKYDGIKGILLPSSDAEGNVKGSFAVQGESNSYEGRTVIICTGQSPRPLGVEREDELKGRGISYCATCDGNFFKGKDVAIVGGGDTAVTEAVFLSRICSSVHLIHRRNEFRASQYEVGKLKQCSNIHLHMERSIAKLIGDDRLAGIELNTAEALDVSAVFVAVGATPRSAAFKDILTMDDYGYILADENTRTNIDGIYAAGDIRKKRLRQVVTAAADGAIAAYEAMEFLSR